MMVEQGERGKHLLQPIHPIVENVFRWFQCLLRWRVSSGLLDDQIKDKEGGGGLSMCVCPQNPLYDTLVISQHGRVEVRSDQAT